MTDSDSVIILGFSLYNFDSFWLIFSSPEPKAHKVSL